MNVAPEVIQKINIFGAARAIALADRAARIGSHVVGRSVSYGALRGAVRGAASGALQGARETQRVRRAIRAVRRFRSGVRRGYSDYHWYARNDLGPQYVGRLARELVTRTSRAGRLGYRIGARAPDQRLRIGAASRTLVRSFARQGRRVASYWRNR